MTSYCALGRQAKLVIFALTASIFLNGCATVLIAGAAITAVDIIHDRRTAGEYLDDGTIEIKAQRILNAGKDVRRAAHVKPVSWNGILLITGEVDSEQTKQDIVAKLSAIQGVRQVVDETTITGKTTLLARTNDAWITTRIKSRLFIKTGLDANRVKVVTTRGSVYLMGIVTQEEANKAAEFSRTVRGVARVVKVFEYKSA